MAYASSVMKSSPVSTLSDATVSDVVKKMSAGNFGAILVVNEGLLEGIFTERDLLKKVVAEGKNPETTLVKEVATLSPITVTETTDIKECATILKDNNFRHLPVVDDAGKAIGIISSRDFFEQVVGQMESAFDRIKNQGTVLEEDVDLYELIGLPTSSI